MCFESWCSYHLIFKAFLYDRKSTCQRFVMVPREKYVEGAQTPLTTFKDIKKSEI